ncbi:ABC transporter ATP-binding protein [Acetobacter estunensis]|uniref:ABC transporter ATP-binding protein n=1 Tax=Acetobacter estunensis TaxID=104097 RepID=A0A967BAA5_9PROT|nr:ABC transporter ATP-binding protein [Acetobacter estunensis]
MNRLAGPMLELADATPVFDESGMPPTPLTLRLMPGECVIVETRDMTRATVFADLCSGMIHLLKGNVRFMGLDWTELNDRRRNALRGRIGRITRRAIWSNLFGTHVAMMLKQLHHTTIPLETVTTDTEHLCERFGLPGIPTDVPGRLSEADIVRAACVRAFLGKPQLLLLEDPLETSPVDLSQPFLESLTEARDRGASAIWFVRDPTVWQRYRQAINGQWRLADDGLMTIRMR